MKLRTFLVLFLCSLAISRASDELALRYREPASKWTEALPVGNGRLGAMVFGGVAEEKLQLNEATLWSGGPRDWNNPGAKDALPAVREALFAGDYVKATELAKRMQGVFTESYQPLGEVTLQFPFTEATDYVRTLDLDRALATVQFRRGDVMFKREVLASHPDEVIALRLTADKPGQLTFTLKASSLLRFSASTDGSHTVIVKGKAPTHVTPSYWGSDKPIDYDEREHPEGMTFEFRVRVFNEGGKVEAGGSTLHVEKADAVTIYVAAGTSFNGFDKSPAQEGRDPAVAVQAALEKVEGGAYPALLQRHLDDHQSLFRRVELDLGGEPEAAQRTTVERLAAFAGGKNDPGLASLLFQYGRYLLIASSRPGGQAANLQGLWNDSMRPPWSSNYTLNINTEMNYWPAEVANLAECHEPLFDLIDHLAITGAKTARINYGAGGWVAHHNSDIWAQSAPVGEFGHGNPMWANWGMSAGWLAQHLWEHYAFGGDVAFLRERAWPRMKGAAEFCLDWLVPDAQGRLVTAPSTSPENDFKTPDGRTASVAVGATMDLAIIRDLFSNCLAAAQVLGIDDTFTRRVADAQSKLLPYQIGSRGQLQEWAADLMETDPHHRHTSHLFGVYPGRSIDPSTPELFAAARRSLEIRGDDGTGWALGWRINLWARFRDGDHAYVFVKNLLRPVGASNTNYAGGGGVYPNLFDAHPPFQIDGNFAFTAGVSEMLLQSHRGALDLLPALPKAWPRGHVHGLRARGGYTVDLAWGDGRLTEVTIRTLRDGEVTVRLGEKAIRRRVSAEAPLVLRPSDF